VTDLCRVRLKRTTNETRSEEWSVGRPLLRRSPLTHRRNCTWAPPRIFCRRRFLLHATQANRAVVCR